MILLDFDNLNILVLFILAYISFKSYQADHHLLESDSDEELSEVQHSQEKNACDEKVEKEVQMSSQINQQQEENSLCPQGCEMVEMNIPDSFPMVSEQIAQPQNQPQQSQNHQMGYPQLEQPQIERSNDGIQNESEESNSIVKNPQSEQCSAEQADDEEQEDQEAQLSSGIEKKKKIRKGEKKQKRESIKPAGFTCELMEQVEIQSC